jgi:hypothetical protein
MLYTNVIRFETCSFIKELFAFRKEKYPHLEKKARVSDISAVSIAIEGLLAYGWTCQELTCCEGVVFSRLKKYLDSDQLRRERIQLSRSPKAGERPISPSEFTVSQIESSAADDGLSISISNSPASGSVTSFTDEASIASAASNSMNLSQHGLGLLAEAALHGCEQSPNKRKRQRDVAGPLDQNKRRPCVSRSEQDPCGRDGGKPT